jgi:hypothetical protein
MSTLAGDRLAVEQLIVKLTFLRELNEFPISIFVLLVELARDLFSIELAPTEATLERETALEGQAQNETHPNILCCSTLNIINGLRTVGRAAK